MEVDFRDAHGFAVPPQYLQKYGEFARIYKEEEKEKSQRWKVFLEKLAESKVNLREESGLTAPEIVSGGDGHSANVEKTSDLEKRLTIGDDIQKNLSKDDDSEEILKRWNEVENDESLQVRILIKESDQTKLSIFQDSTTLLNASEPTIPCLRPCKDFIWADISPSLSGIEQIMSQRVKRKVLLDTQQSIESSNCLNPMDEATPMKGFLGEYSEEKIDWVDIVKSAPPNYDETANMAINHTSKEFTFPLKVVECLVRDGVPMCLRGELWQAFVGVRARKVDGYYQKLLNLEVSCGGLISSEAQKWKWQIEKDLPRTFPGHPALDEDGRNALRRLLTAYAQHNPSVGYCQAMNFFAGLLLMLMPEENAFWTLLGIIDDYFEGYYTEEMIEAQVDQLVLEGIIRERFPKLVHHLDFLGVQVAWITGPWFLSIFLNVVPWETALRVWDALLFYGNRVMLFHIALALLELHGSELVAVKDAGDAVTLLKSLAASTFDSSQLVLTACMGYQTVNEVKLQELRKKYRAGVVKDMAERSISPKHSISLATQLYSFKHDPDALLLGAKLTEASHDRHIDESKTSKLKLFSNGDADLDLTEQVTRLKVKLCRLLGEKRSENIRAEQLETAFMEMIKQDNRRILIAKVEHLEKEKNELKLALISKQEQEHDMIKALVNLEQEQKVVEDARLSAEQAGAAQKYAASILKEKYEAAMVDLAEKEKRALMAETLLEATVQYQSGQVKVQLKTPQPLRTRKISEDSVAQRGLLSRPYGWFDKHKGKPNDDAEKPNEPK